MLHNYELSVDKFFATDTIIIKYSMDVCLEFALVLYVRPTIQTYAVGTKAPLNILVPVTPYHIGPPAQINAIMFQTF